MWHLVSFRFKLDIMHAALICFGIKIYRKVKNFLFWEVQILWLQIHSIQCVFGLGFFHPYICFSNFSCIYLLAIHFTLSCLVLKPCVVIWPQVALNLESPWKCQWSCSFLHTQSIILFTFSLLYLNQLRSVSWECPLSQSRDFCFVFPLVPFSFLLFAHSQVPNQVPHDKVAHLYGNGVHC